MLLMASQVARRSTVVLAFQALVAPVAEEEVQVLRLDHLRTADQAAQLAAERLPVSVVASVVDPILTAHLAEDYDATHGPGGGGGPGSGRPGGPANGNGSPEIPGGSGNSTVEAVRAVVQGEAAAHPSGLAA